MKIFEVYYINNYDAKATLGFFTTKEKAESFIESSKKPFYKGIVLYDYRGYELEWDEWDLDEFDDIVFKNK